MTPHQGAGAGQGFEVRLCAMTHAIEGRPETCSRQDGFLLAQFLGRADITKETVQTALQVYDEIRRPLSQKVAEFSHMCGLLHVLEDPEGDVSGSQDMTIEELHRIGEKIEQMKDWRRISSLLDENDSGLSAKAINRS